MEIQTSKFEEGYTNISIIGEHEKTVRLCEIITAGFGKYSTGQIYHNSKTGLSTAEWCIPDHMVIPFQANFQMSLHFT